MIHQTSFGRLFTSKPPLPVEVSEDLDDASGLLSEAGADEPPKTGAPLPVEVPDALETDVPPMALEFAAVWNMQVGT